MITVSLLRCHYEVVQDLEIGIDGKATFYMYDKNEDVIYFSMCVVQNCDVMK